jgi:hypothetical protein
VKSCEECVVLRQSAYASKSGDGELGCQFDTVTLAVAIIVFTCKAKTSLQGIKARALSNA